MSKSIESVWRKVEKTIKFRKLDISSIEVFPEENRVGLNWNYFVSVSWRFSLLTTCVPIFSKKFQVFAKKLNF